MPIEEILQKLHEDEVDWDEVRERRVFNRIRSELDEPRGWNIARARLVFGTLAGVCALIVIGFLVSYSITSNESGVQGTLVASNGNPGEVNPSSTMVVGGVGQIQLISGARVAIWQNDSREVKLHQNQGKAVYDIEPQSGRQVSIYANGVEIRVVGTVFTVTVEPESVHVEVDEGIVRVNDGHRLVELRRGEAIGVATAPDRDKPEKIEPQGDEAPIRLAETDDKLEMEFDILDTEPPSYKNQAKARESADKRNKLPKTDDHERVGAREPIDETESAEPKQTEPLSRLSTNELFHQVDQARKRSDFGQATQILEEIITRTEDHSSVVSASFTLGKIERSSGRHVRAARAFAKCHRLAPNGPLAEDAMAEEAAAWYNANVEVKAQQAAERYLTRYPKGIHEERMRRILEEKDPANTEKR